MSTKILSSDENNSTIIVNSKITIHFDSREGSREASCQTKYNFFHENNNNLININNAEYPDQELYLLNFYEECLRLFSDGDKKINLKAALYDNYNLFFNARNKTDVITDENILKKYFNFNKFKNDIATYAEIKFKNFHQPLSSKINTFLKENNLIEGVLNYFQSIKSEDYDKFKPTDQIIDSVITDPLQYFNYAKIVDDYSIDDRLSYEIVGYRIDKYQYSNNNPIRTWILPKIDDQMIEDYVFYDTEIMYNKRYNYKISLLLAIVGQFNGLKSVFLTATESDYFADKFLINNSPPLRPNISIIPYAGVDKKILILASNNIGNIKEDPITIEEAEFSRVFTIKEYQLFNNFINSSDGDKILFESHEENNNYIFYKLDRPPRSYQDFSLGIKQEFTNNFIDDILPNKKYYYIFRTQDRFSVMSNPTEVFSVELVNNSGYIYPIIETYKFDSIKNNTVNKRHFNKKMEIKPAAENLMYHEHKNIRNLVDKVGISDFPCWGKNFKIRITSLATGKKLDFNIKFTKKEV